MSESKQSLKIWRSFEAKENNEAPSFGEREFPESVQELIDRGANAGLDRKKFLTLMGASLSMATVSCMREPVEKIIPYVDRPAEAVPGMPVEYATVRTTPEGVKPVLVKTREGKPIKIEPHDEHPVFAGAISPDTVASIWDLYDPDRIKAPLKSAGEAFSETSWEDNIKEATAAVKEGKVAVLSRSSYSPSETAARESFLKASGARSVVYDPLGVQNDILEGERKSFGKAVIPNYRFDRADFILSLEADFLGTWLSPEVFTKQFSSRRTPDKNMNRLVVAESMMSVTGANADTRLPVSAGTTAVLGLAVARQLLPGSSLAGNNSLRKFLSEYTAEKAAAMTGLKADEIVSLAGEMKKYRGRSLVVGGGVSGRSMQNGELQIIANLLNTLLGNDGKTVLNRAVYREGSDISSASTVADLIADMKNGEISTLIIDRANPVYELANAGFASALEKVENVVYMGYHLNDTAVKADYVLPVSHYLEDWSDALSYGTYSISQPVFRTLFDTRSAGEIWLNLNNSTGFLSLVKKTSANYINGGKKAFDRVLSNGYIQVEPVPKSTAARRFSTSAVTGLNVPVKKTSGFRMNLYTKVGILDGSGANIAFRQEMPDPVTKVTWENYLAISPADAREKELETGDVVEITSGKNKLQLPVFIQPGMQKGSVAAAIGYGQQNIGKVAAGIGQNVYKLALYREGAFQFSGIPVDIKPVSEHIKLASTQRHHELGVERGLVRTATLAEFMKDKKAGNHYHIPPGDGLYTPYDYDGNRWNISIDLNKCTGCSACVVSCYSENNIPAVGKDEVNVGREMSWLRIDRYYAYASDKEAETDKDMLKPVVLFQPLMCQHCENAPCENVCPVGATGHSNDGLNYMTYNRCIGTRYCANNCPYKVRRFNWFENWEDKIRDPQQFALNPDVTVRSRGVIEKCSFCQQRISEARQTATVEHRDLKDGEIKTACQQSCPADAIVFGDVNLKDSQVNRLNADSRSYKILAQVNVNPAVNYMVKIRKEV